MRVGLFPNSLRPYGLSAWNPMFRSFIALRFLSIGLLLLLIGCAAAGSSSTSDGQRKQSPNIIYADEIIQSNAFTLAELLVGRIPGVYSENGEVRIRGNSSIQGSNEPLYVMDDMPLTSEPTLVLSNIESIEVLKGNEAARFGIRGMNGAILITTRSK